MTVLVIAVAIAFLMNMLTGSMVQRKVYNEAKETIADLRLASVWVSRLQNPGSTLELLEELAGSQAGSAISQETAGFLGLAEEGDEINRLHRSAATAEETMAWAEKLDYGDRRRLLGPDSPLQRLDNLAEGRKLEEFFEQLRKLRTVRLFISEDEFRSFIGGWPETRRQLKELRQARREAVNQVEEVLGEESAIVALGKLDKGFAETVAEAGFVIPAGQTEKIQRQAIQLRHEKQLEKALQSAELKRRIAGQLDLPLKEVTSEAVWTELKNEKFAQWFLNNYESAGLETVDVDLAGLREIAGNRAELFKLGEAQRKIGIVEGGLWGLGERTTWLLFISLMVCVVGITNAMLMSVTERYREIATLKCLGALDGSILLIFVMEACLLGLAGSIIGVGLGIVIGLGRMGLNFGELAFSSLPWLDLMTAFLVVTLAGIILAGIASIYPSLKAARLAPMEAMRIE